MRVKELVQSDADVVEVTIGIDPELAFEINSPFHRPAFGESGSTAFPLSEVAVYVSWQA